MLASVTNLSNSIAKLEMLIEIFHNYWCKSKKLCKYCIETCYYFDKVIFHKFYTGNVAILHHRLHNVYFNGMVKVGNTVSNI